MADAIFRKSMPHNTHRCQIKRFWHRSRDVRELAPLCTQTHMYKQINQTNYTSLSLSQTSVFYCLGPLSLPRSVFSLHELIWHRSKVGDPYWAPGEQWRGIDAKCITCEFGRCFGLHSPLLYSLRPKILVLNLSKYRCI